mmetsp:Transcript_343/g.757  ORF Transcript_343/g.757 Transcript_343/m.757 type:complete len:204 (-) Transcript_343:96-707(-)
MKRLNQLVFTSAIESRSLEVIDTYFEACTDALLDVLLGFRVQYRAAAGSNKRNKIRQPCALESHATTRQNRHLQLRFSESHFRHFGNRFAGSIFVDQVVIPCALIDQLLCHFDHTIFVVLHTSIGVPKLELTADFRHAVVRKLLDVGRSKDRFAEGIEQFHVFQECEMVFRVIVSLLLNGVSLVRAFERLVRPSKKQICGGRR